LVGGPAGRYCAAMAYDVGRQRTVLLNVAWLWLWPMIPSLAGEMIGRGFGNAQPLPRPMPFGPLQVGAYFLICFLVGWLYAQGARRLQERIEVLAAVDRQRPLSAANQLSGD